MEGEGENGVQGCWTNGSRQLRIQGPNHQTPTEISYCQEPLVEVIPLLVPYETISCKRESQHGTAPGLRRKCSEELHTGERVNRHASIILAKRYQGSILAKGQSRAFRSGFTQRFTST